MALRQEMKSSINSTSIIQSKLAIKSKSDLGPIPLEEIHIEDALSCGSASQTFLGSYHNELVVIKQYKVDHQNYSLIQNKMLDEWNMLKATFPSQYIIKPIGYQLYPPQIIMEYAEKGALDFCIKDNLLTTKQKINIANECALGILELLKLGIIHRDIKSANILITHDFHAKLCDFDLSRKMSSQKPIYAVGTPSYAAPEYQIFPTQDISLPAADVFSFGIVLLEMFVPPEVFYKYHKVSITRQIGGVVKSIERIKMLEKIIEDHRQSWPNGLDHIIGDCLKIIPEERASMKKIQKRLTQLTLDLECITELKKQSIVSSPIKLLSDDYIISPDIEKTSLCNCSIM